jgi:preprotein translocase subunit SecD
LRRDLRWKLAVIVIVLGTAAWFAFPLEKRINLGLDLQGGMHLVLEVEAEKAVESTLERLVAEVTEGLTKQNIPNLEVQKAAHDQLVVRYAEPGLSNAVAEAMKAFPALVPVGTSSGTELRYGLEPQRLRRIMDNAMDHAM